MCVSIFSFDTHGTIRAFIGCEYNILDEHSILGASKTSIAKCLHQVMHNYSATTKTILVTSTGEDGGHGRW